jgi:hypothetical protein
LTANNDLNFQILTTADDTGWRAALPAAVTVFGSLEFARIVEKYTDLAARLCVIDSEGFRVAYPFFLRSVTRLPFAIDSSRDVFDTVTPEYTGPMAEAPLPADLEKGFTAALDQMFRAEGVVAEFAHIHPWNGQTKLLHTEGIEFNRDIVYVDVTLSEERLWKESFSHACRKNINRASQKRVRIFTASEPTHIAQFHRIYEQTMVRTGALQKYFFPVEYFLDFFNQMPGHSRFTLAEYDGQIVAATLYLHDQANVYSYLGGADHAFQDVRPTNAVVYDTICWARSSAKERLILGGGYRPDDGIFRFKSSFSPLRAQFQVYKHVHLKETYGRLCGAWADYYAAATSTTGFFPAYRATPPLKTTGDISTTS